MSKQYRDLLSLAPTPEVPGSLLGRIIARLEAEHRLLSIKRRLFIFSATTLTSVFGLAMTIPLVKGSLAESGFIHFFSLLFSDTSVVIASWQSFALSLLESLPLTNLIMVTFILLVFLESLKFLLKDLRSLAGTKLNRLKI